MISFLSDSVPHNAKNVSLAIAGSFTIASCNYIFYQVNKLAIRTFKDMTFTPEKVLFGVGYCGGIIIFSQVFSLGLKMLMKSWETNPVPAPAPSPTPTHYPSSLEKHSIKVVEASA